MGELEETMGAGELREWVLFEQLEGPLLVQERIDWAAGLICSTLARVNGGKQTPRDFKPQWSKPSKSDLAARLMGMVESVGVREDRRDA